MKYASIIGDSISTFEGYNPANYSVFYTKPVQAANGLNDVRDTWWAIVLDALHANLCVNNSFSGSLVSGSGFPAGVSDERVDHLSRHETVPDLILIYIGLNDYGHGVSALHEPGSDLKDSINCFEDAYDIMLGKIRNRYPDTKVVCGTLLMSYMKYDEDFIFPEIYMGVAMEDYNEAIRKAARKHGCLIADLSSYEERYETLDSTHPTGLGHKTIADLWIRCLSNLGLCDAV